jgi:hypothetical protein
MRYVIAALLFVIAGCATPPAEQPQAAAEDELPAEAEPAREVVMAPPVGTMPQLDPNEPAVQVFALSVYDLSVPMGEVTRNDELWKRLDEQALDVATTDILNKNGIRVAVGFTREWEHLREHLDDPDAQVIRMHDLEDRQTEVTMRRRVPDQVIAHFESDGSLVMKTRPQADLMMNIGYRRTPRQDGSLRVSLTPSIRSIRQQPRVVDVGDGFGVSMDAEEFLYDLNLRADVAVGEYLIVAASEQSDLETLLGRVFFREQSGPELLERVLVVVPQTVQVQQTE